MKKSKEVKKKKRRLRIQHNKKLFWVIIMLLIILIVMVYYIRDLKKDAGEKVKKECNVDGDCVPKGCCHPESCVKIKEAEVCEGVVCTAVCSGPLDCGTGHCGCIKGKCEIVPDN